MAEILGPEEGEQQEVEQVSASALAILNQSEHAAMVQTANLGANRRKLVEFESKLLSYASHSQPIALSMFYSLPRAGKQIIGPSVRFAEIVAPCWKNCAVGSRALGAADSVVTAQGIFIDYEANLRNSVEVPRRISDKDGRRFSDDMIVTTMNAAMSVARRNAVLKGGVPQALWTPAYEQAQLTAVGKAESHALRVANAMEYLLKLGVTEWQILNSVGVPSVKELETEHLLILRVLCGEIKRGDKTIEDVFGSPYDKEIDALFAQLKMNQAQQTMLRNSYAGRAAELVTYLRDRVGNKAPTTAPVESGRTVNMREQPTGTTTAPGLSGEPINKEVFSPKAVEAKPKVTDFAFGANEDARESLPDDVEQEPPIRWPLPDSPKPQTTMDAGTRKRGRPSAQEVARRAATAAGYTVPDPPEDQDDFKF